MEQVDENINRNVEDLNIMVNTLDWIDIYRTPFPTTAEYRVFQLHMEQLPKQNIFWAIMQYSTNFKGLKSEYVLLL